MINRNMANQMVIDYELAQVKALDKEAEDFCENKLAPKIEEMATIGKRMWEEYCPIKIAVRVANYLRRHNFSVNARCFDSEQEIIEIKW